MKQTVREEYGALGTSAEKYVKAMGPTARIYVFGTRKDVVRDRRLFDLKAVVDYVRISAEFFVAEDA
jgi:hypothetical protein